MDQFRITALPAAGRLLMSAIFIIGGYGKLVAPAATVAYFGSDHLPVPDAAYAVAVVTELGGGIAILLGIWTRPVALWMCLWCLATGFVVHLVPGDRNMMIHFWKNICMAGGFLQLAALGAGNWSLYAMLVRRSSASTHVTA